MHITRGIVDSVSGSEPSTTKNHLLEVNRNVPSVNKLERRHRILVKDLLGMGPAVDMLMRTLDPGRINIFPPYEIYRSSRSTFSTVWKDFIKGVLEWASLG